MVPLENINQLKNQGKSEQEIIGMLQEQGHAPREITEALNQLKIKNAVNPGQNMGQEMSPSIMSSDEDPNDSVPSPSNSQQTYTPQPPQNQQYSQGNPQAYTPQPQNQQNYSAQNQTYSSQNQQYSQGNPQAYTPQPQNQEYSSYNDYENQEPYQPPQNQYSNNQDYSDDDSYSPQEQEYEQYEGYAQPYESTDTIIEIAEQVFSEKSKELEDNLKELIEFKRIYEQRINEMNERLKRMEKYFDKMQIAIMDKVASFGKNIQNLQNEINMVEDSFSKVVNPLTDNPPSQTKHKTSTHKK